MLATHAPKALNSRLNQPACSGTVTMRPNTGALDAAGREYVRLARVVGELSKPADRLDALESATKTIAAVLGLKPTRRIPFGMSVYSAFMTRPEALKHPQSALLLTRGDEVSLDYCPEYN